MTSGRSDLIDIAAECRRTTEHPDGSPKSYLLFDGDREAWVPASQVEDNQDGTFAMPVWLAKDKGFV
jgi:hypothetical protein